MELHERRCAPCEGAVPRLADADARALLAEVPSWELRDAAILRTFVFADFAGAMAFVDRMAETAEAEGHHPDFCVHWNRVDVTIWTHAAGGLTENDFILAAKIDRLAD
jgi:4a-hydroxytetrahydrobiopterin dehydratase